MRFKLRNNRSSRYLEPCIVTDKCRDCEYRRYYWSLWSHRARVFNSFQEIPLEFRINARFKELYTLVLVN